MFKKFYILGLFALGLTALNAQDVELTRVGGYATGVFDEGACEIVSYSSSEEQLYYVNANAGTVGILDISSPDSPVLVSTVDVLTSATTQSFTPGGINAVSVGPDFFVVAVEADVKQDNGVLAFFSLSGIFYGTVPSGALPDNIQVSASGDYVVSANEGEPNGDYSVDPLGSVTIVDVAGAGGADMVSGGDAMTVDFTEYNGMTFTDGTRIFGEKKVDIGGGQFDVQASTVAEDLEPEYVAYSADETLAFISCQENNTVITVDVASGDLVSIDGLGFKDHSLEGNGLDASNRSVLINIDTAPVLGMYQPDAMVTYSIDGVEYLFTANEGDARDYDGFSEEDRLANLTLDPTAFPNAADIQNDTLFGRLKITTSNGDTDGDGDYDEVYIYGARSFSIWDVADMSLVYDSGDEFEQVLALDDPVNFNSTNDENDTYKNRSDDKGCEPEAIDVGTIGDHTFAFIGLERMGGVMVFDVTDVSDVEFKTYNNNRDFTVDATEAAAGDLAPECVKFIAADKHSGSADLLAVSNEVSGTISIFEVEVTLDPTNVEGLSAEALTVYPNPTIGSDLRINKVGNYVVMNTVGQVVVSYNNINMIPTSMLANGTYFLVDTNNNERTAFTVMQ